MEQTTYYQDLYPALEAIQSELETFAQSLCVPGGPAEHYKTRIKSPDSMREKLVRRGLPQTLEAAVAHNHDAVGLRLICPFLDDVTRTVEIVRQQFCVAEEKDYIRAPKPNGYRSYHMIICFRKADRDIRAEIQLRTIAMDCWASLEHQMKYKRRVSHQALIVEELKRCAEELASADLRMQTIRELLAVDDKKDQAALC